MTNKPSSTQVEKIRAAATAGRRSVLYRWMNSNFDVFQATVAEAGKPNWAELAKAFTEEQLWDISGKPPTGERARLTWLQVRKTREDRATKSAVRQSKASVGGSPPKSAAAQQTAGVVAVIPTISPIKETTNDAGSDSFKFDKSPREDDKNRLWRPKGKDQ